MITVMRYCAIDRRHGRSAERESVARSLKGRSCCLRRCVRLEVDRKQIVSHGIFDGYRSSKGERWRHCVARNGTYSDSEDADISSVEPASRDPHSGYDADDASVMEALDKISGGAQVRNAVELLDDEALSARRRETKVRYIRYEG